MISLPADENLDGNIVRGVLRRVGGVDIVPVQDVAPTGADDPTVQAWAADQGRVLVIHDVATVTRFAFELCGHRWRRQRQSSTNGWT